MTTNLKQIEKTCEQFENSVENLNKELKRIASIKCRLKKEKGRKDYDQKMTEILKSEQILKEAKMLLEPKEKTVTTYTQEDVNKLDYDETIKAIKSIQSKKTHTKWLSEVECDNDEYRNAVRIEKMLLEHKSKIRPVDESYIRKSDLQTIIDTIESNQNLSQERILELLNNLM